MQGLKGSPKDSWAAESGVTRGIFTIVSARESQRGETGLVSRFGTRFNADGLGETAMSGHAEGTETSGGVIPEPVLGVGNAQETPPPAPMSELCLQTCYYR